MENKGWKNLPLSVLQMNEGQINDLPRNPRTWTYDDIERLKKSIEETPELLDARGLIVVEWKAVYVVIGGNMRYTALKALGRNEAPCYILPADTPISKLKEIVVKDNGSFGDWDLDMLKADWNNTPFVDWGIIIPDFAQNPYSNELFDDGCINYSNEGDNGDNGDILNEQNSELTLFEVVLSADEFMFVKDYLTYAGTVGTIESGLLKLIEYGK